jgi:hypothetical protein
LTVALLFFPSFNYPVTGAAHSDRIEVETWNRGAAVDMQIQALASDDARSFFQATLWVSSDEAFPEPVEIWAFSETGGMLHGCTGGDQILDASEVITTLDDDGVIEYTKVTFDEREDDSFICDLDPARLLATDGAVSLLTVPAMYLRTASKQKMPTSCVQALLVGVANAVDEVCNSAKETGDGDDYFASRAIQGAIDRSIVSTLAQSRESTRTLVFGLAAGVAGGFAASLATWFERSRRRSRNLATKSAG